jgi:hypothetical protein
MNRYMVKIEAGGLWHRFVVEAIHGQAALVKLYDLGLMLNVHNGIREAREDEPFREPTQADIDRLRKLGWTFTPNPKEAPMNHEQDEHDPPKLSGIELAIEVCTAAAVTELDDGEHDELQTSIRCLIASHTDTSRRLKEANETIAFYEAHCSCGRSENEPTRY